MKCLNCPLCVSDYCDACGDGDIIALSRETMQKTRAVVEEQTNSFFRKTSKN